MLISRVILLIIITLNPCIVRYVCENYWKWDKYCFNPSRYITALVQWKEKTGMKQHGRKQRMIGRALCTADWLTCYWPTGLGFSSSAARQERDIGGGGECAKGSEERGGRLSMVPAICAGVALGSWTHPWSRRVFQLSFLLARHTVEG